GLLLPLRRQLLTDALDLLQTHLPLRFLRRQFAVRLGLLLLEARPLLAEPVHLLLRRLLLVTRRLDARCQGRLGRLQAHVFATDGADVLRQFRLQTRQRLPGLVALRLQLLPATLLRLRFAHSLAG